MRLRYFVWTIALLQMGSLIAFAQSDVRQREAREELERAQMKPVRQFLAEGGDPNARNEFGGTLLETATNWNHPEAVRLLLERGADPNQCRPTGECALYISAARDTEILRMLVTAGADVNRVTEKFGYTPLGRIAGSRPEIFTRLLGSGGYRGQVPNSIESAKILLRAGANVNHVDGFRESPLRTAMRLNNLEMAKLLLASGADVHQRIDDSDSFGEQRGNTILMVTIWWYEHFKDIQAIELLLSHGANPNDANDLEYDEYCDSTTKGKCSWRGYTALAYAARYGWPKVVMLLLRYGADSSVSRGDGKTALGLAIEHQHPATAKLLRAYRGRKLFRNPAVQGALRYKAAQRP